jgi:hypothetical protein
VVRAGRRRWFSETVSIDAQIHFGREAPQVAAWRARLLEGYQSALRRGAITQAEYDQRVRDMNLGEE